MSLMRKRARPDPGIVDRSYRRCQRIAREHGKTYAMAARLLPPRARGHVHAVYAFCRTADDIVDELDDRPVAERARALATFGAQFRAAYAAGHCDHPILAAVVATAHRTGIHPDCFDRFLASMSMDLEHSSYPTWTDLLTYMDGSAAVIGEMMLPVLHLDGPHDPASFEPARQLGIAFQLTNFLRDVGEDLDRGRVYLPQEDLERFRTDPRRRHVDDAWRALLRFEIERTRQVYDQADRGICLLPARSAGCVRAARVLYARILDRIEAADFDVFNQRARVPAPQKAWVAMSTYLASTYAGSVFVGRG